MKSIEMNGVRKNELKRSVKRIFGFGLLEEFRNEFNVRFCVQHIVQVADFGIYQVTWLDLYLKKINFVFLAQLVERQTEDLKASCSIHEGRIFCQIPRRKNKFLPLILQGMFQYTITGQRSLPVFLDCHIFQNSAPEELLGRTPSSQLLSFCAIEDTTSEQYLSQIEASEWKKHDHYKILALGHLRISATDEDLKQAYRRKVLLHHPDKHSKGDNVFKCLQKSYEILTDPTRRRQFDSVDPTVTDTVPTCKSVDSFDEFRSIFEPIFQSQKRFSKKEPVPDIGEIDTDREAVEGFYHFWFNFESWRTFEWHDEEQSSSGDNREDKRWIDKKNKAARQKRKNEDNAKIIKVTELAMKLDPRIKSFKEQDKALKESKKQATKAASSPAAKMQVKMAEDKKVKEAAIMQARQRIMEEKALKDKNRLLMTNAKKEIEEILIQNNYFITDFKSNSQIDEHMSKLENWFSKCTLDELKEFKADLLKNGSKALDKPLNRTDEQVQSSEWTSSEMQLLIEAVKQFPGGTINRWEKIASFIANKSKLPERAVDDVIQRASSLKQAPKATGNVDALLHATQVHQPKSVDARIHQNAPTDAMSIIPEGPAIASAQATEEKSSQWTAAEFGLLEKGLAQFPSTDPERWSKIAELVGSKTKKECKLKFLEIAEKLKSSKSK